MEGKNDRQTVFDFVKARQGIYFSIARISKITGVSPHTVSDHINALETMGLLKGDKDPYSPAKRYTADMSVDSVADGKVRITREICPRCSVINCTKHTALRITNNPAIRF